MLIRLYIVRAGLFTEAFHEKPLRKQESDTDGSSAQEQYLQLRVCMYIVLHGNSTVFSTRGKDRRVGDEMRSLFFILKRAITKLWS